MWGEKRGHKDKPRLGAWATVWVVTPIDKGLDIFKFKTPLNADSE